MTRRRKKEEGLEELHNEGLCNLYSLPSTLLCDPIKQGEMNGVYGAYGA